MQHVACQCHKTSVRERKLCPMPFVLLIIQFLWLFLLSKSVFTRGLWVHVLVPTALRATVQRGKGRETKNNRTTCCIGYI